LPRRALAPAQGPGLTEPGNRALPYPPSQPCHDRRGGRAGADLAVMSSRCSATSARPTCRCLAIGAYRNHLHPLRHCRRQAARP
jgi:hypothetical protein